MDTHKSNKCYNFYFTNIPHIRMEKDMLETAPEKQVLM